MNGDLAESLLLLVHTLATGLGIGATAMVARRVGERDLEGASQLAVASAILFERGGWKTKQV
jgi:Na+-driven multidrug efflux pump